ncbi:hypothetical protein FRB93_000850 [Tulasnella sp. JGI-2019a]|nr:hypothetical protein FRB93_000850 [Tulasnella sp. JGI-2019a]
MAVSIPDNSPSAEYVTPDDVKAHLYLLGAFVHLRRVHGDRWPSYVEHCIVKFREWIRRLEILSDHELNCTLRDNPPDLEILMVWHTYLLNPVKYHHHGMGIYPTIQKLGAFPLSDTAERLNALTDKASSTTLFRTENSVENSVAFDLKAAVLRQCSFISKVESLGWTKLPTNQFISSSIARYSAFLKLVAIAGVNSFVPTLDIVRVSCSNTGVPQLIRSSLSNRISFGTRTN